MEGNVATGGKPNCILGTKQPEMVLAGFVVYAGEKTLENLHLTNHMVCDW